jgi:hypothetical protein
MGQVPVGANPSKNLIQDKRKYSFRREAGVSTPAKANRIFVGLSPGGTLFTNFTRNLEFFRSL